MSRKQITLLTGLLAATSLFAQQKDTVVLDEVVVTANKLEQKQSTTGKLITVISKEQIEKSQGKTVAQLLNEQAGITINGAFNNAGSVQTLYMRGAAPGRTLILMDGIPLNDPSTITTDFDLNLFSINDVERIEVCRGAQSTLYGSDAIAGVVNIITVKKDVQKALNFKTTISQGNYGTSRSNFQAYGKKGKLTYTARYARLFTNGFSSAYDSTGTKNFDNDRYDGNVANAQLLYQINPHLSVKTFVMYSQYKASIDAGVFNDDRDYTINNKSFVTGAGFQYQVGRVNITGNYLLNNLSRNYFNDSIFKTGTWFENNTYKAKSQFAELYANTKISNSFTLLTGVDYRRGSYFQDYFSTSAFGPFSSKFRDTFMTQTAVYGSLIFSTRNKSLNIELGGRYNDHSRYGNNSTYTFNPSWTITKNWRVYGSISSGFKAPSLYQLSLNKNLDAEKSVNYDGGLSFQTQQFGARATYFHREIKNGIDYNYITFSYFNYVKQTVNGLELELSGKLGKSAGFNANYTLLTAEEITQNRLTTRDTVTYNYLLRRPKHQINLSANADLFKGFNVMLTGRYVSSRFDIGGYRRADISLPSYFLLGANISYQMNEQIRFFADAQNITNKKFFDARGFNAIPFLFNAGINFNW